MCDDVYSEMLSKHPQVPSPSPLPPSKVPDSVEIREALIIKALKSFPAGTAPGPSGLQASHLKEALSCLFPRFSSIFLKSLCNFVDFLSSGGVPAVIVLDHLCDVSLTALKKKSGSLHPIAVGEVIRWLISKCIGMYVSFEAVHVLSPQKVGVGIPVGSNYISFH